MSDLSLALVPDGCHAMISSSLQYPSLLHINAIGQNAMIDEQNRSCQKFHNLFGFLRSRYALQTNDIMHLDGRDPPHGPWPGRRVEFPLSLQVQYHISEITWKRLAGEGEPAFP